MNALMCARDRQDLTSRDPNFNIFKDLLYSFSIIINIKIVDITAIVNTITIINMTKIVFCNEMLVVINDPLSLLILT